MTKKITLLFIVTMFTILGYAQNNKIYLPKSMEYTISTDPDISIYENYSFDKENRLKGSDYYRRTKNNPNNGSLLPDYGYSISIKYDKKTGLVEKAETIISTFDNSRTIQYETTFYDYKFNYLDKNRIDVEVEVSLPTQDEDKRYDKEIRYGDIEINEKGVMETSSVEKTTVNVNITHDDNGNITELKHNAVWFEFTYNDKAGMFKDSETPMWLFPFLFNNYDQIEYFMLNRASMINGLEKAKVEMPVKDDPTQKELLVATFTYTYNTEGYPVSFKSELKNETRGTVKVSEGKINYSVKKVKK